MVVVARSQGSGRRVHRRCGDRRRARPLDTRDHLRGSGGGDPGTRQVAPGAVASRPMKWKAATVGLACLLGLSAAGCGSSGHGTATTTTTTRPPTPSLKACLQSHGYAVTPESPADVATAPRRFDFTAVWNLLNPSRIALALTFSRSTAGAKQAVAWTRRTNAKLGKGAVHAPVVRLGRIAALWTADPPARDANDVYGCIRRAVG